MDEPEALRAFRIQELQQFVDEHWQREAFRRFQCIWLNQVANLSADRVAAMLRLNISTVKRVLAAYRREGRTIIEGRGNRGGRRHGYLTLNEEAHFLNEFLMNQRQDPTRTIRTLKSAYEIKVGKQVNRTTIYRLLERHGWGHAATQTHHVGAVESLDFGSGTTAGL